MTRFPQDLPQKVKRVIARRHLIEPGSLAVVGVSGGPDSLALLNILFSLRAELGLTLQVAHFNHRLRKSADSDEEFVRRATERLGLGFTSEHRTGAKAVSQNFSEDDARQMRLAFFHRVVKTFKADCVVLAHTQNDLAETVLMRLIRGSGLAGLRGILPESSYQGIRLVRPLLECAKEEILTYLKQKSLSYREDPTNHSPRFLRNHIRLKLLPLLEREYQPGIVPILARLAEIVGEDYAWLDAEVRKNFNSFARKKKQSRSVEFDSRKFLRLPLALQRSILRLGIQNLQGNLNRLTFQHMEEMEDCLNERPIGSKVNLPGTLTFVKEKEKFILHKS